MLCGHAAGMTTSQADVYIKPAVSTVIKDLSWVFHATTLFRLRVVLTGQYGEWKCELSGENVPKAEVQYSEYPQWCDYGISCVSSSWTVYLGLQDGKKGEILTCIPSPYEIVFISRCSDSKVTVGGACAKCIIGTTRVYPLSSCSLFPFSLLVHLSLVCRMLYLHSSLSFFVQRIVKMSVLISRNALFQDRWCVLCT